MTSFDELCSPLVAYPVAFGHIGSQEESKAPPLCETCAFFIVRKEKRCRLAAVPGHDRCRTHLEGGQRSFERVPCPLDPRHSVNRWQLDKHLKICTALRDANFVSLQPFFKAGANAGQQTLPPPSLKQAAVFDRQSWLPRIEKAYPVALLRALGSAGSPEEDEKRASWLLEQSLLDTELGTELGHADKHGQQNAALAKLASQQGIFTTAEASSKSLVVEYGCGRGGLALSVLEAVPGARGLLVDRDTRRHKVEKCREGGNEGVVRLRMDIEDFDLSAFLGEPLDKTRALPQASSFDPSGVLLSRCSRTAQRLEELWARAAALQNQPPWPPPGVLVCAKHLCGGATDVALRSLLLSRRGVEEVSLAVCCATCCHHRCDAQSYVNLQFLTELGLCRTHEEFGEFVSTAGWGVGGQDRRLRRAGLMTKRILDLGRVAYLREELGLAVHLTSYIGKEVTPENIAIVGSGQPLKREKKRTQVANLKQALLQQH
ncbi:unnamed protein product [Polarella glacialis]|uniref:tRNA:m(4)X modification enzyme TRM13 n=1 Tax=Polarella glacialis TaxID=89957 RepID=A0A813DX40_POLGL|nr:unnamed protein product [Polarella glacialis]